MIDTVDIDGWERWTEKESSGVNRNYSQAYINTRRASYIITISTRTFELHDECTVTAAASKSGEWKSGGLEVVEKFEGTSDEAGELIEQAEEFAREWMQNHPCERNGARDDKELLTDLFSALEDEGLVIQHDMGVRGWTPEGHHDTTTHNVRAFRDDGDSLVGSSPSNTELLRFIIGFDGKASGLSYREYEERQGDDYVKMHEPRNEESLHSKIRRGFSTIGFDNVDVKKGSHQMHWDHTVTYIITAELPEDFDIDLSSMEDDNEYQKQSLF